MGCAQSKIDQEEAVSRCKDRKRLMAEAVTTRNAFAAAHSAYAVLLKSTGGALSDYAHGEAPDPLFPDPTAQASSSSAAAGAGAASPASTVGILPQRPPHNFPAPPPPLPPHLPDFPPAGLQRSVSMPDIPIPNSKASRKGPVDAVIHEEEDDAGHIRDVSDSDDVVEDDDDDDHHEHDDVDIDEVHKQYKNDSIGSSPVTPTLLPRPNPLRPMPASTLTPPMPEPSELRTWDDFFGPVDATPPPTLAQPDEETWMERREPEVHAMKTPTMPKPAVIDTVAVAGTVGKHPPVVLEKAKATEELSQLPPLKPIVKKPPKVPGLPTVYHQSAASMGSGETRMGKIVVGLAGANLLHIVAQLDDHFLKASASAHDVSKKLEATRMHYHSNHADSRGHIDHSAKIMQVITWNRSFKISEQDEMNDNFEIDEKSETHATILDKMLAWEKKLYDEVKAGELMKIDYQRKVALLHKQKKHGVKPETLEKTKAAVSHLHTRYIVDMQSMDQTVSEINRLRDEQLYPKLVDLVDGMAKMWDAMHRNHHNQFKIISQIKSFEISPVPRETSDLHFKQTCELRDIVREWLVQFEKLMNHQKEYIRALNGWLGLNIIPIESSLKEKVSSPPRQAEPPIKDLLHAWHDQLERLPVELAKAAIKSFADVMNSIILLQEKEVDLRRKCEETRGDLDRKKRKFEDWHQKYVERRASLGEDAIPEIGENRNPDPVTEGKVAIEEMENKLREEEESHRRLCRQVREKSLASLRTHLPELFRSMTDFALFCTDMYRDLWSIAQRKAVEGCVA